MDLGCLDLGCISVSDKHGNTTILDSDNKELDDGEKVASASKTGKNKSPKGTGQSALNALNKFTSQIKKPYHRKSSPLNWFPRKKMDSYLKRKIKMLQEVEGMNSTLDETLGDSNPHYSRVLREKIAAREAAHAAMEARKAALVEASWCRILRAARIQSKEAEAILLKAEKSAAEAFEAATAMGVIMYDIPNSPQRPCQIETSTVNGGRSTTHTVTASFETPFDVDKQVAAAVKTAFIRLANCPSFNKDEFKDLLRKIRQNPDTGDNNPELSEFSSECESESGSELETLHQNDGFSSQDTDCKLPVVEMKQGKYRRRQSLEKFNVTKLVDMMLERLRCLKEDELSSLATIVATCGLNAALAEVESSKLHDPSSVVADCTSSQASTLPPRMSSAGAGTTRYSNLEYFMDGQMRRKQVQSDLPSLDKFLVKHMSKLEIEVQEAKNRRKDESGEANQGNTDKTDEEKVNLDNNMTSSETIPDLGSILVKHSSKFEKEIEEAKKNMGKHVEVGSKKLVSDVTSSEAIPDLGSILVKHSSKLEKEVLEIKQNFGKTFDMNGRELGRVPNGVVSQRKDVPEIPGLDKFLVKHVSRLEKEVQEAKNRRKDDLAEDGRVSSMRKKLNSSTLASQSEENASSSDGEVIEKENVNLNKEKDRKSEMDKKECAMNLSLPSTTKDAGESLMQNEQVNLNAAKTNLDQNTKKAGNSKTEYSLDKILVKPVHRLEREKMQALSMGSNYRYNGHQQNDKHGGNAAADCEGLDKVLVKHVSRLEKEKMLSSKEEEVKMKRSGRNIHLQINEEGGLDQILVRHKSRLEREKMASAQQPGEQIKLPASRREAREKELQEAWGGLSLGNSIRPHLSKLEREKAAWIKAEEEERRRAMKEV